MTETQIKTYFSFLRTNLKNDGLFYCCNRLDKVLPDGERVSFFLYPWDHSDKHLIDEESAYYRWFFSPAKTIRGLECHGLPIPFGRLFDGPMHHRLSLLK